ncbi:MAG: hypothetical protein NTW19_04150 [Planctomycetota bacterium]|nr:hypothetical protein [Planctomycetota bacterium]
MRTLFPSVAPRLTLASLLALIVAIASFLPTARADELDAMMQQIDTQTRARKSPEELASSLVILMTTGTTDKRRAAMWDSRIYIDNPAVVQTLKDALQKGEPNLASMAALALGHMKIKAAGPPLAAALGNGSSYVRESAAYGLAVLGDPAYAPALKKARPDKPGLAQWIFDDALHTLGQGPATPDIRRKKLRGASVFYLGGGNLPQMLDGWKPLIDREALRLASQPPRDLNPQMGLLGGPIDTRGFFSMLDDRAPGTSSDAGGNPVPQIDVVLLCNIAPDEFPFDLQWRLFNFMRRGGTAVFLGDSFFSSGQIQGQNGKVARVFAYVPEFLDTVLPHTPDKVFHPLRAGMTVPKNLGTAQADVGRGKVIVMSGWTEFRVVPRGWDNFLRLPNYENILRYAVEGDAGFPAIIDGRSAPEKAESGQTLSYKLNLFSCLGPTPAGAAEGEDQLTAELFRAGDAAKTPIATRAYPLRFAADPTLPFTAQLPTDWRLPSGDYEVRLTFRRKGVSSTAVSPVELASPLRLDWSVEDHYRTPGGELAGAVTIHSKLAQPIEKATAIVELHDPLGRVLQRWSRPLTIKPGRNETMTFALQARAYRTDSYPVHCSVVVDGATVERSDRHLFHTGPAMFDQDIVMAPFGGLDPAADQRSRDVMVAAGFNGVGGKAIRPGWYNWSYDVAPKARASAVWPGDLIERMNAGAWGQEMRDRAPGWSVIDQWDEGSTKVLQGDTGQYFNGADVFYRNWLKAKYLTLDRLNAAWREHYKNTLRDGKPMQPLPWEADLTSWEQVKLGQGSPVDWHETNDSLWWQALYAERCEFQRTSRFHQLWHNGDIFHTRIYSSEPPGTLAWQQQQTRGALGNRPSSIMMHVINAQKGADLYARFPWNAIVAGSRHMSVWSVGLAQTGTFGFNPGWTILEADYTVKSWWKPAAASLERARSKDQVLLDAWNSLSPQVAFLYVGHAGTPRALFDALYFAGIVPESINPYDRRGNQLDLGSFKVIYRLGPGTLPPMWQAKLDAWQKAGGLLTDPPDLGIEGYGGKQVDAEVGIQHWVGSDQSRLASASFAQYQAKVLALLAEHGVRPVAQLLDDAGLPAPAVESVLLETHDKTQYYLLAVGDSDIQSSQALGSLGEGSRATKTASPDTFYDGAEFTTQRPGVHRLWLQFNADKPFDTHVTVDGQPPLPFRTFEKLDWFRTERGLGQPRWVAGPAFNLAAGPHKLRIEHRDAARRVQHAVLLDQPLIEPTLRLGGGVGPTVKAAREIYDDLPLKPTPDGGYRLPVRQSQGSLVSLITEDLGRPRLEPRLVRSETDRVLQVRVEIPQKDGSLSRCRHSATLQAFDAKGQAIPGFAAKTSVLGWRVVPLFPAAGDPPPPWTIRLKDLTSGATAEASVATDAPEKSAKPWDRAEEGPAIELRTDDETMSLDGQIHLVPLRVTVVNNRDAAVEGKLSLALPEKLLLEGGLEKPVRVEGHKSATVTWPLVLGRDMAKALGLMQNPPRATLTLSDGKTMGIDVDTMWARQWEKQPPLVTDMGDGKVEARVLNFLDRPVNARVTFATPVAWQVVAAPTDAVEVPAGAGLKPGVASVSLAARVKPDAEQMPDVSSVPMTIRIGEKSFDAGGMLVEAVKERTWFTAKTSDMEGGGPAKPTPEMPKTAIDAKRQHWIGLDWQPFRSDTLVDFPSEFGRITYGVTNVRFAKAGRVSVRVRGQERVDVWLAGRALNVGQPTRVKSPNGGNKAAEAREARADAAAELEIMGENTTEVPAGTWLPLVVRYRRESADPLTDLVFLDEAGKVIWSTSFRAEPGP